MLEVQTAEECESCNAEKPLLTVTKALHPGRGVILAVTEDKRSRPSPGHGWRYFPLGQTQIDVRGEKTREAVLLHQGVDFALGRIKTCGCRLRDVLLNILLGRVVNVNLEHVDIFKNVLGGVLNKTSIVLTYKRSC